MALLSEAPRASNLSQQESSKLQLMSTTMTTISARTRTAEQTKPRCMPPLSRHWRTLAASVAASIGSMALGSVIGYTSPAVPDINWPHHESPFRLDASQTAWAASIISIGGLLGTPVAGYLLDKFGRKTVLMLVTLPFVLGWLLIACATSVITLYCGRLVTGFCCGVIDVAVPVYIAELAPTEIRGFTGSCHELSTNIGLLFVFAIGCVLRWNWLAVACLFLPVLLLALILPMPESPRWLVANGRTQDAKDVLRWLRGSGGLRSRSGNVDVSAELAEIELNVRASSESSSSSVRLCDMVRQSSLYRPFVIIGGLMFFQQFSGYGVIPEYMVHIFQSTHTSWNPYVQTAIVGLFGVVANLVSALVVDRMGRRRMLVISALTMVTSMAGLGTFFTLKHLEVGNTMSVQWVPTACLITYNSGVALGFGPVPFFLASELFPLRARGLAGGMAISLVWFFMFITNLSFPHALLLLNDHGVYWIMTGFSVVGILFVLTVVPETKGKSLEEIEMRFKQ